MGGKKVDRLGVIRKVLSSRLRQREAAEQSGLGARQVRRLIRRYQDEGSAGLVSRRRGRRPNNALNPARRREVMDWVRPVPGLRSLRSLGPGTGRTQPLQRTLMNPKGDICALS